MKKISLLLLFLFALNHSSKSQTFNFSLNSQNQCFAGNNWAYGVVTSTPTGATSFSWAVTSSSCSATFSTGSGGWNFSMFFPCAASYTISGIAYNGSTPIATSSLVATISPTTNMSYSGNTNLCAGSSATITLNTTGSYTWSPGNLVTSNTAVITPTVSTNYTVAGPSSTGCVSSNFVLINVAVQPTVNIAGAFNGSICSNGALTASGASTYTWAPNNITGSTFYPNTMIQSCYTVTGVNSCGTATAAICVTPLTSPALTVTGASTMCVGTTLTLTASGASTYTWLPMLAIGTTTTVSPGSPGNYNYTIIATGTTGCNSSTIVTVSVGSGPNITTSAVSSGCNGSFTLTASGGSSYVWTQGTTNLATTASVVVSPTASTCYTVTSAPMGTASCPGVAVRCVSVTPPPSVQIGATHLTICPGWYNSIYAVGASSYTWYPGGTTGNTAPIPTSNTCYTVIGSSAMGCTASATQCFTVTTVPPLTVSGNTLICQGTTVTFIASGASSYTWTSFQNSLTAISSIVSFTPVNAAGNLLLTATNSVGCINQIVIALNPQPSPTVSISGNAAICPGQSTSLMGSGLNTYTWSNGPVSPLNTIAPTSSTCYTLIGVNGAGCVGSAVKCVTVLPVPAVTISGNNNICIGSSGTLTASGANTYVWSNLVNGATNVVTPFANTCYTVTGTNSSGCTSTASACMNILITNLTVAATSPTVCRGSSVTFTASGAATYTWNNSTNTSTFNVTPTVITVYTVSGTGSNGCHGTYTVSVGVDTTCSDVWPGDANSDGVVGSSDILEIGLQFAATGAARNPGGNTYVSQFANNWAGTISSGKNKAHADCNGDGVVNLSDTVAIVNNFALTHAFKPSPLGSSADINIVADGNVVYPGQWNKADVMLGSSANPVSQLYGLTFDINIDQTQLLTGSPYLVYTPSFLNANNQNVEFRKAVLTNNKIYAATVRTDHNDVNGEGKIAELWFFVKSDADLNSTVDISVSSQGKINSSGVNSNITGGNASLNITDNLVTLNKINPHKNAISVFPNPASEVLVLKSTVQNVVNYMISNLLGQQVVSGNFTGSETVNVSALQAGSYIITFKTSTGISHKKIVIE